MRTKARGTLLTVVTALAGALTACSTLQVSRDYDRSVEFSKFKTFTIVPSKTIQNDLLINRLDGAITAQLEAKGLRRVGTGGDLEVAYDGRLSKETYYTTTTTGYGWAWRWRGRRTGVGMSTTTAQEVPVGTLVVMLADAESKQLVWEGEATDTLQPKATPERRDRRVSEVLAKMFEGYPPPGNR